MSARNSGMSSRERMLAALGRDKPDYVPFSPYIAQGPFFKEPLFWHDQIERAERMLELGLDPVMDIWLPDVQPHPDVEIRTWRERKGTEVFITKEFHTPAGVLRQTVHETEDWCHYRHGPWIPTTFGIEKRHHFGIELFDDHNVSRRTEPWVERPEDVEKLRFVIRPPSGHLLDEWRMDAQRAIAFAQEHELLTIARRTIVGDAFLWFCDVPWFMIQLYDDPDFVEEFLGVFQDWSIELLELVLALDVDVVQYRGWYEIPTYWGVKSWRRYIVPLIEAQTELVHNAGKLHTYLLPEMDRAYIDVISGMKLDALQALDPRMLHDGDMQYLFGKLGNDKSFWGGIDAEITLNSGDRGRIEEAVQEAIETLGRNGGLILSAVIFPDIPHEGILYMIEAWRKYKDVTG